MKDNPNPTRAELELEFAWTPNELERCTAPHPDGPHRGWCKREPHPGMHANLSGTWQPDLTREIVKDLERQFTDMRLERMMEAGMTRSEALLVLEAETL